MMNKSFSYRTLSVFFHDISIMIPSGAAMEYILSVLSEDCAEADFSPVLSEMRKNVSEGESLSSAMKKAGCFPAYSVNMISAAEQAGKLEESAEALSVYYEHRERTQKLVSETLTRPLFLLFAAAVIMGGFILAILPALSNLYTSLGGEASMYIGGAYAIGGTAFGLMLLAIIASSFFWLCSKSKKGSSLLYQIWTKNRLTRENALLFAKAQFISDVDVRLSGGILLDSAFEQAAENVVNPVLRENAKNCAERLFKGESLGNVLLEEKLLPPVCNHILYGALQTGDSEKAFHKVRERLFDEAETRAEALINRVEPALTGFFTISIGLSLLSVMLPLIGIFTAMG